MKHVIKDFTKIQQGNVQNAMKFQLLEENAKFVQMIKPNMIHVLAMMDIPL